MVGVLRSVGVGSAQASDVDVVHHEIAAAAVTGADEHHLKVCEDGASIYAIPSDASHCLNGSEPKMLSEPIYLRKLRD